MHNMFKTKNNFLQMFIQHILFYNNLYDIFTFMHQIPLKNVVQTIFFTKAIFVFIF